MLHSLIATARKLACNCRLKVYGRAFVQVARRLHASYTAATSTPTTPIRNPIILTPALTLTLL